MYHATIWPNIREGGGGGGGGNSYTTSSCVQISVKARVVPDIPRHYPSKAGCVIYQMTYPSKAGLCQLYHAAFRPNIRQRRGCVR